MVSAAFPSLFFAFAGWVLFLFVSVSPPAWDTINFLKATANGSTTVFGVLGQCVVGGACTAKNVGYNLVLNGATRLPQLTHYSVNINPTVLHNLTYTLVLNPIAGFLGFVGFIFGLIAVGAGSRGFTIGMSIFSILAAFVGLVSFVIDIILFVLVKQKIDAAGYHATLGNALWLEIGGVVAFFLSMCTSICGACGRGRMAGEKY